MDVEQDDVRLQLLRCGDRRGGVGRLPDDPEPVTLEHLSRARAKAGVIIDDEDGLHHVLTSVAQPAASDNTGTRSDLPKRNLTGQRRSRITRAPYVEPAAERLEPVREPAQTGPGAELSASDSVV